jgi:antitoxin YefM
VVSKKTDYEFPFPRATCQQWQAVLIASLHQNFFTDCQIYCTIKRTKGGIIMLAVNYSTLRNNLKAYCDKATDESETVIVTRKNEKNVVIMSLEKYNNLRENLFLMQNRKNYQHILKGIEELEQGQTVTKAAEDLEEFLIE